MGLQGPDFSDSRDPIFFDSRDPIFISRDPNRVPKTPQKTLNTTVICCQLIYFSYVIEHTWWPRLEVARQRRSDDDVFSNILAKSRNFEVSSFSLGLRFQVSVSEFLMKSRSRR